MDTFFPSFKANLVNFPGGQKVGGGGGGGGRGRVGWGEMLKRWQEDTRK